MTAFIPLLIGLFNSLAVNVPKMIAAWKKTDEYDAATEAAWQSDWQKAIDDAGQVEPDPEP